MFQTINEEILTAVDSLEVGTGVPYDGPHFSIADYFVMGGLGGMIIITVLLILLLLAAWKAPRWVKEIGIGALVFSIFWTTMGLINMCDAIQTFGDVSPAVLCGGFKVALIPIIYGLIVYFISLVIRVIQKPRI
jgi:uncharacterized membrane protein